MNNWRGIVVVLVAFCFSVLWVPSLTAQETTGRILGTVLDSQGKAVPGAQITITNQDTGVIRNAVSGPDGLYNVPQVPDGNYTIESSASGFGTMQIKNVVVTVATDTRVDLTLQVGSVSQTVTVNAAAPLVDTTSSSLGSVVDDQRVADLPLNGRNWTDLTLMQAGVTQLKYSSLSGGNNASAVLAGFNGTIFSSNGATIRSNLYTLDGANMMNLEGFNNASASNSSLGVDGIKEYKIVTSTPDAEYGLVMGSQTTIVSKSGTNRFHGDAFDYLRNNALDARNYFDALDTLNVNGFGTDKSVIYPGKRLPPYHRNDFGGSLGGPLQKDKTFFFGVYEGIQEHLGVSTVSNGIPAACFVNQNGTVESQVPAQIKDVNQLGTCVPTSGTGTVTGYPAYNAATGVITMDARMLPIADVYPFPNVVGASGFNYALRYIQPTTENYGQMRVDHTFSASDSAFARYTQDDADRLVQPKYPSMFDPLHSASHLATLAETHILSPSLLNTFRFSYSRTVDTLYPYSSLASPADTLATGQTLPVYTAFAGAATTSENAATEMDQDVYTWSDDIFWTKKNHLFKFGMLINHFLQYTQQNTPNGQLGYTNLVDFLTNPNNYNNLLVLGPNLLNPTQFSNLQGSYRNSTFGFYAQDDYRMNSRLIWNLGLRYEFATVPRERDPAIEYSVRNPLTDSTGTPGPLFANNTLHNFSPRVGFAWDVTGKGTTAVRGGVGVYYDVSNFGAFETNNSHGTPPVTTTFTWTSGNRVPLFLTAYCPAGGTCPAGSSAVSNSLPFIVPLGQPQYPRTVLYDLQQPTMVEYNLDVQQQLPWQMLLTVGYAGSHGWHLYQVHEGNPVIPVGTDPDGLPFYGCWNSTDTSYGVSEPSDVARLSGVPGFSGKVGVSGACPSGFTTDGPRENPALSQVFLATAGGNSYFNSFQVQLLKRISQGLQFQFAYTFAHSIDSVYGIAGTDGGEGGQVPGYFNERSDRGPSIFDIRNNIRANLIYRAPDTKFEGVAGKFLNGWWWSSIISAQGGAPFNVTLGGDRGLANSGQMTIRPSIDPSFNAATVITGNPSHWFNPTMFDVQPAGHLGDAGRDLLVGPGLLDVDFSAVKDTKAGFLGEEGVVQIRAEVFNILNHSNFLSPSSSLLSPTSTTLAGQVGSTGITPLSTVGSITSTTTSSRQIQLALKIIF